jgi:phage baseplate assembly protein W
VTSRYRAWKFEHPDFDRPDGDFGLRLSAKGGIAMVDEESSVRQSILLLMSTRPGERIMRPDYGCDLQQLAFSPNDDTTAGLAVHYVRQALSRWEPRIDVLAIDASPSAEEPGRLDLTLAYRVRATQREERLSAAIDLNGTRT